MLRRHSAVYDAWGLTTASLLFCTAAQAATVGQAAPDFTLTSIPSANTADIKTATNYVRVGLNEALAGKPISKPTTQPYGCSVKYKS